MNILTIVKNMDKNRLLSYCLLGSSFVILIIFIIQNIRSAPTLLTEQKFSIEGKELAISAEDSINVEISGSVASPGAYFVRSGSRLAELLTKSGSFTKDADRAFFSRNFNLARILNDQDKIHVPSYFEVNTGKFRELDVIVNEEKTEISKTKK
jgi:DNA uptake protein ComE-like DNA-binding protein